MDFRHNRFEVLLSQIVFGVIFVLLSTLIIVAANGYRFDWRNWSLQQTGLISLTVRPDKVTVSLDGVKKQFRSPVKLPYLLPDQYDVEVSKAGYTTWRQSVQVGTGQAVIYPFVVLFLKDTQPQQADQSNIDLLQRHLDDPVDSEIDVRGTELWVKPLSRTYPFSVAGDSFSLISRFSRPILKAIWLPDRGHVIFQLNNRIHVIDRDGSNDNVLATLKTDQVTNFITTNDGRYLIYQDGETIWQRQIQ